MEPFSTTINGPLRRCLGPTCFTVILAFGALGMSGCTRTSAERDSVETVSSDHEHHSPEHKPADFPQAVHSLLIRYRFLSTRGDDRLTPRITKEFQEAADIAGWLPELAADCDLHRAEWDRVNEASKRLADEIPILQTAETDAAAKRVREQIESDLQCLDEVLIRNAEIFPVTKEKRHFARTKNTAPAKRAFPAATGE